eukprot:23128-Pelagococcus_subviridis.AAC.2
MRRISADRSDTSSLSRARGLCTSDTQSATTRERGRDGTGTNAVLDVSESERARALAPDRGRAPRAATP